ncbi:MAG: dTDP-4-dehydrorhamnose 3,5-epimerase family protein [Bryobacteraceae bacterium]|nr:dTDP-4-dehydrorhamnose 3,5-epimerase family protein [Bryobacteraceae bacterium]
MAAPALSPRLSIPSCAKGIGSVITSPNSSELIAGVRISPFPTWPDDRGYFFEVMRSGQGMVDAFPAASTQVSAALNYPGIIKAFHFHHHQTDCWCAAVGMLQVALADLRPESLTFGKRNTIYTGALRPWQIIIPPGVAHGYKVISREPSVLIYVTDRFYNPEDEGRIAYNDPGINYDWELQHK